MRRQFRSALLPALLLVFACSVFCQGSASAFPKFQEFVEKHSGRTVNCALCHSNDNGPQGDGAGQLGSLSSEQQAALNKCRAALDPGVDVDNPVLNRFGNSIVKTIGMKKFLALQETPQDLPAALGNASDLDSDGIPDSEEYMDGTDTLNKYNGDPVKLFKVNIQRYWLHVLMAALSIGMLNFGLSELLKGFEIRQQLKLR